VAKDVEGVDVGGVSHGVLWDGRAVEGTLIHSVEVMILWFITRPGRS
jgi:hypothetical protein